MTSVSSSVGYRVFPNGFAGENQDMVSDYCDGVLVQLSSTTLQHLVLARWVQLPSLIHLLTRPLLHPQHTLKRPLLLPQPSLHPLTHPQTPTATPSSATQIRLLKACLGDSDGKTSDNVDSYNWDTGTTSMTDVD